MLRTRVIPSLLLQDGNLVKTTRFRKPSYVGDPINAVRIFNRKEVDELTILDIGATAAGHGPDMEVIREIVSEAFMPLAYGGGITTVEQATRLFELGIEKIVLNSVLADQPGIVDDLAARFGSQSVVVAIDVGRSLLGRPRVMVRNGRHALPADPGGFARQMENRGAGEILLTAIDRESTGRGYDCELVRDVASAISIPLVANGGASKPEHFAEAVAAGASAVSAGSLFIYHGPHRAVLISYPDRTALEALLP